MIAINATLQVDLTGQCCSESIGWRQYSAVGGQADFARGAFLSKGGKSFLCLYSTAKNGTLSTIVPYLSQGASVSTQRQSVMYIVTEYGVATMWGKSTRERAKELIRIAHPKFREEIKSEARKMKLL
jgi:acyl-CoA hydrolase